MSFSKKMKKQELKSARAKTVAELQREVKETSGKIANVGLELRLGKHKNTRVARFLRRNLAQLKTILGERQLIKGKTK